MARVGDLFFSKELECVVELTYLQQASFFCGVTKENVPKHVVFVDYAWANHPDPVVRHRYKSAYMARRPTVQGRFGEYDVVCFRGGLWEGVSGWQQHMAAQHLGGFKEELMQRACHPCRYMRWCVDVGEEAELCDLFTRL